MAGWFTDSELTAIRSLAELGMQSQVIIKKRTPVTDDTDPRNVYGDDAEEFAEPIWGDGLTTKGWLFSTPSPVITVVGGVMALVNTYRLFVPVGTDVESGDRVDIDTATFIVSDTVAESTWLPMLVVSLRRVE